MSDLQAVIVALLILLGAFALLWDSRRRKRKGE